jgi:hypothetical protein
MGIIGVGIDGTGGIDGGLHIPIWISMIGIFMIDGVTELLQEFISILMEKETQL